MHKVTALADALLGRAGGRARLLVILLLSATLSLAGADLGTIAAAAPDIKRGLGVSNTEIGVLLAAVTLVGSILTVPFGALTDRLRRVRLLAVSMVFWSAATLLGAFAQSFLWLLLARVALGAVVATAGPTVASLTGDFFPPAERGSIYGWLLSGELVGTAIGFVVSSMLASLFGWRVAVAWLAPLSLVLAWTVHRLPEPARGGGSQLQRGDARIRPAMAAGGPGTACCVLPPSGLEALGPVDAMAESRHVEPRARLVLHSDPADRSLWWALRYVLRVPTNRVAIAASALAYFYLSGLTGFGLVFAERHFEVGRATATMLIVAVGAGALAGAVAGGHLADHLLRRGWLKARIAVPAVGLASVTPLFAAAFLTPLIAVAVPLLALGALALGAASSPADAARLDIMHPHLWGRSEGVRSASRSLLQAAGPIVFGFASEHWPSASPGSGRALDDTFLVCLGALVLAALAILPALRTYPRDVATADASIRSIAALASPAERSPFVDSRTGAQSDRPVAIQRARLAAPESGRGHRDAQRDLGG